jgi:hypothetical protein
MCIAALPAWAQAPRIDVLWARQAPGATITLDGVLDEPAWASAEQKLVRYTYWAGDQNGIPGSGYVAEGGKLTRDSTYAILKFLVVGNQLYMAAVCRDTSVGGSADFNRFDGFLMGIKDHLNAGHPKPPVEYFYSWWYPDPCDPDPVAPGKLPDFRGRYGNRDPQCGPRTPEMIAAWDAFTRVRGLSNSDAVLDSGYVVEMRFDLGVLGYDVTDTDGDVVEFNIQIYDVDWYWPFDINRMSADRTWWQSPWGLDIYYHQVQIHSRPGVNLTSGAVPVVAPDVEIRNADSFASPVIDGAMNEAVWTAAPFFDIRYGDDALRDTYPGVLRYRAGQYQPEVLGATATVLDPGNLRVKWFFKADTLFLGYDVTDVAVGNHPIEDRWDGVRTTINHRVLRWRDHNLESRALTFRIGAGGALIPEEYLPVLRDSLNGARFALQLKPGTTVDTVGTDDDAGYTVEMAITLTKLGYPAGRGDGILFIGFDYLDGDAFFPTTLSYATRTWWGRERQHSCCPAWAYLNPALTVDAPLPGGGVAEFGLVGNAPNPFRSTTMIRYALDRPGEVSLEVFDLAGRRVARDALGMQPAGSRQHAFTAKGLGTGLYLYRIRVAEPGTGAVRSTRSGKMMLVD